MNPDFFLFKDCKGWADAYADAPALVDRATGRIVRYSALLDFLKAQTAGIPFSKGTIIATRLGATFDHAALLLGLLAQGCVVAPLGPRIPEAEAIRRAEMIGASCIIDEHGSKELSSGRIAEFTGTILFTSGSSGMPRAVSGDIASHLANTNGAKDVIPLATGDGWLLSLPLHHVSGFSILIRCLTVGATVVFPDPQIEYARQVEDGAVTHLSVVALQLQRLLESDANLQRLKAVLAGGGPIGADLLKRSLDVGVPLHITYGMTETASQITTTTRLEAVPRIVHAGKPLPRREVRISPHGIIEVRGQILARDIAAPDGWFSTGDTGEWDGEGNLVIRGRSDRMIISGGENIHPEAIESLLADAPGVRRVVVVGVPNSKYGMRPVAFILGEVSSAILCDYLAERVERFAIPDEFFPWPAGVDPKNAKVDYRLMERLALESV